MKLEKSRHLAIFNCILSHDGIVTCDYLAEYASCSVRTIKSDIAEINEELIKENIARIGSTRSKGYYLEPLDELLYNEFIGVCAKDYGFYRYNDMDKTIRKLYILQKLLSNDAVLVDDLSDALYLSKSALKDDLSSAIKFLNSYSIEVESMPRFGLSIKGSEDNLRDVMAEAFCSQYHDINIQMIVSEFNEMFYDDKTYYADIRHEFLRILRNSKIVVRDITTKKLATYLCLTKNRIKNNHHIIIDVKIKNEIAKLYEYELAKEVFKMPLLKMNEPYSEDEIVRLAISLMCYRDIDLSKDNDISTIPSAHLISTNNLLNEIIKASKNCLGASLFELELFEVFRNDFLSLLLPFYLRSVYDLNSKQRLTTYYELTDYEFSPMAIEMIRNINLKAEKLLNIEIDGSSLISLIGLVDYLFKKVNLAYKKQRIATLSTGGLVVSKAMKMYVLERFGGYIERIDVYNQYEMRSVNFTDFDFILTDMDTLYNFYPLPFITYKSCSTKDTTLKLFNDLFKQGYSRKTLSFMISITKINDNFDCDDYLTFFKLISYAHAKKGKFKELEESFINKAKLYSFYNVTSSISMIFADYNLVKEEFIEIFIPSNKMMWTRNHEIKYIVLISLKNDYSIVDLKTINKVLQFMWYQNKAVSDIVENINDGYQNVFDEVIMNRFLRK